MLWPMVLRTRMSEDAPGAASRVLVITVCGLAVSTTALLVTPYLGGADWLAAAGMACYLAGAVCSLVPAVREMRARPPRTAAAWALLAGNAWLLAALIADIVGLGHAGRVLDRLLVPVLGVGLVGQVLVGALTFLLPVTVGGPGNRWLTAILEYGCEAGRRSAMPGCSRWPCCRSAAGGGSRRGRRCSPGSARSRRWWRRRLPACATGTRGP